jgi:hypothetical protein
LAVTLELVDEIEAEEAIQVEVDDDLNIITAVNKYVNGN